MRQEYPSDITREQFGQIKTELESKRKITHPRRHDLYDIFCAILYVLREGCRWRGLPHDFPKWNLVYYYFQIWSKADEESGTSLLENILSKLVALERVSNGRKEQTSMLILDSKSIKNADTAKEKGYDAGKKLQELKYI